MNEKEYIILNSLDQKYKYITRQPDNELVIHENFPHQTASGWWFSNSIKSFPFENLFLELKSNERYKISELISLEKEKINDLLKKLKV